MDDPATGAGEDHDKSREQHVVCFDRDLADDDPAPIVCPCDQPFCVSSPDVWQPVRCWGAAFQSAIMMRHYHGRVVHAPIGRQLRSNERRTTYCHAEKGR